MGQVARADRLGHTEIGDDNPVVWTVAVREEDVRRLDVPVDDSGRVGGRQSFRDFNPEAKRLADRDRVLLVQQVAKRLTGDQFHDDRVDTVLAEGVIDRHDVSVVEPCCCKSLPLESMHKLRIIG